MTQIDIRWGFAYGGMVGFMTAACIFGGNGKTIVKEKVSIVEPCYTQDSLEVSLNKYFVKDDMLVDEYGTAIFRKGNSIIRSSKPGYRLLC